MSQEMKDVRVCFRPLLEVRDVLLITHRALQEFPRRILPEFKPWYPSVSDKALRPLRPPPVISREEPLEQRTAGAGTRTFERSWCVITHRTAPLGVTHAFSGRFRKTIEQHGLSLRQRVKWVVCERNCGARGLEELWREINRAVRRSRLPTCNANFQRALAQIWLYCDVFYCEYIGNFLKQEFQLSGKITLTVHKLGDIIHL